jgi:hypothetical protein
MASIEREVENALLNVVSGIGGVNFFTSERGTARTLPSVTVQAQIGSEELVLFGRVQNPCIDNLCRKGRHNGKSRLRCQVLRHPRATLS